MAAFDAHIPALYQAFQSYGPKFSCIVEPDVPTRRLKEIYGRGTLKTLSSAEVDTFMLEYSFSAPALKFILPRALELGAHSPSIVVLGLAFVRLREYDFKSWPAQEQEAVKAFLSALFEETPTLAAKTWDGEQMGTLVSAFAPTVIPPG